MGVAESFAATSNPHRWGYEASAGCSHWQTPPADGQNRQAALDDIEGAAAAPEAINPQQWECRSIQVRIDAKGQYVAKRRYYPAPIIETITIDDSDSDTD